MLQQRIKNIIISHLKHYDVESVGIFGSSARGDSSLDSDIDILVKFKKAFSLLQLIKIENDLSEKLGTKVDLVTEGAIKNNHIRESINEDLQIIYRA